jgi:hypothetical protein
LGAIRNKWLTGETLTTEEIQEIKTNHQLNPDNRIRKTAEDLLNAINGCYSGHALRLIEQKTFNQVKKLIVSLDQKTQP